MQENKFLDAPLIHPYNAPKYHASLVRAQQYAYRMDRILLWAAAEDQPQHRDHLLLSEEELAAKREEWSMLHDQKTSGVMGLLPLTIGMPLRITQTECAAGSTARARHPAAPESPVSHSLSFSLILSHSLSFYAKSLQSLYLSQVHSIFNLLYCLCLSYIVYYSTCYLFLV